MFNFITGKCQCDKNENTKKEKYQFYFVSCGTDSVEVRSFACLAITPKIIK